MGGRLMGWLSRAAIRLYPAAIRQRYGDEISGLLNSSPAPVRDLLNVVWAATAERGGAMTFSGASRSVLRAVGLLAVPLAITIGWLIVSELTLDASRSADGLTIHPWRPVFFIAAPAVLIIPPITWLAWRAGRRPAIAGAALTVPAFLALGAIAVASIPNAGTMLGERYEGSVPAIVVWFAGMAVIGLTVKALVAKGGTLGAALWQLTLGFVVLDVAMVTYFGLTFPRNLAPWSEAVLWYPVGLVGMDGSSELAGLSLHDSLKMLPHVLTVLSVFTLAWQLSAARKAKLSQAEDDPSPQPVLTGQP